MAEEIMKVQDIISDNHVHLQELSYSCGPCSLLNILHLQGDFSRNEEDLAKLCGAKPGVGTSHEALLESAPKVGLEVVESKSGAAIEDLERNIDAGGYVVVNYMNVYSGEGHYGLVTDYDDKAVYLVDSSFGFIRIKKPYFLKYWYGSDKIERWYASLR